MKKITLFTLTAIVLLFSGTASLWAGNKKISRVDIVGDNFYLDGRKFFVKGIGYSPYRPGKYPGNPVPVEIVEADFKRIKDAGFNTLRVWDIMPEEQLGLAEKHGLKVIQAAYLKPDVNFNYSGYLRAAESKVRRMCRLSKNYPNVIMYLLMNEPHAQAVVDSGVDNTLNMYRKMIEIVKEEDPSRPVSMANAYWTLWLDQSPWDIVSFNAYNYAPLLVSDIGYANFIKNLKSIHSKNKPFLVTEYGLSISPEGSGGGGYGGNTEKEQADILAGNFRDLVEGGAIGGCVFEWNDEWWKAGNASIHDGHAEEWFGIVGIESKKSPLGMPRQAYYRMKEEMKIIITSPIEGYRMPGGADIEVNASDVIKSVWHKIDNGQWVKLTKNREWWKGAIDGSALKPGLHTLTVKGIENNTREIVRKVNIIKCRNEKDARPPVNIKLMTDKPSYKNGDEIKIEAHFTDREGAPLKNHYVKLGALNSVNSYSMRWEGYTDDKGFFSKAVPALGEFNEWYYIFWAGAEMEDYGYKTKEGKISYVKTIAGEGFPVKWLTAKKAEGITIDGIIENAWSGTDKIEITADTNFAEGSVKNSGDLSAEARVLWDESNIYLLACVKDNVPMKNEYEKLDLWKGDCVELFISVDPAKIPEAGYSGFDFQILIGTNGKMWIPGQRTGGVRNNIPVSSKAAARKNSEGYTLEAKINLANFGNVPLKFFSRDNILGFDIAVGDADESGMRDAKLIWNGTGAGYKNSAVWGRLKLEL